MEQQDSAVGPKQLTFVAREEKVSVHQFDKIGNAVQLSGRKESDRVVRAGQQIIGASDSSLDSSSAIETTSAKALVAEALVHAHKSMISAHVQRKTKSLENSFVGGKWFELQQGNLHVYVVTTSNSSRNRTESVQKLDRSPERIKRNSKAFTSPMDETPDATATNITSKLAGKFGFHVAKFGGTWLCSPRNLVLAEPRDGCSAVLNEAELRGKVAVVLRGGCFYASKARMLQEAGAVGMVLVNDPGSDLLHMPAGDLPVQDLYIPSMMISATAGKAIQDVLEQNTQQSRVVAWPSTAAASSCSSHLLGGCCPK